MESAKTALGITKYFITLPTSRKLFFYIVLCSLVGSFFIEIVANNIFDLTEIAKTTFGFALPSIASAFILKLFRRKVKLNQALFLALISMLTNVFFSFLGFLFFPILKENSNVFVFSGFALSFLIWFLSLSMIFGIKRSAIIFSLLQVVMYLITFNFTIGVINLESTSLLIKALLTILFFLFVAEFLIYIISRPLKKNLKLSTNQVIEMFSSQWLYKEQQMEEAFEKKSQDAATFIAVASFKTKSKVIRLIVPYIHFGPFGNLGGSEFPYLIDNMLKTPNQTIFVFHGTATHSMDPVRSSSINQVTEAISKAIKKIKYKKAFFSFSESKYQDSICYLFEINDSLIASFSRFPKSTEDIDLGVGLMLIEKMKQKAATAIAIDCHNCETEEVEYVQAGSTIAMEMTKALENCLSKTSLATKIKVGAAQFYPNDISAIGGAGIKVLCISSENNSLYFIVLLDSNSIEPDAREKIVNEIKKEFKNVKFVEVYTTDTHELNAVKGVFNPAGKDIDKLQKTILNLAHEAYETREEAEYGAAMQELNIKVLGPYQTVEIPATLNAIFALLKIFLPIILIGSIIILIFLLNKLSTYLEAI